MRFRMLADLPPDNAETYLNLRWIISENTAGKPVLKYWIGKVQKPTGNYYFQSMEKLNEYLQKLKTRQDEVAKEKTRRKTERKAGQEEMKKRIEVGTLLHYSWGWEQTNCDFYHVVQKKGCTVKIRPIGGKEVPGSCGTHGMSCYYRAVKDNFIKGDEVLTKRIGPHGITMDHGSCSITTETEKHYCSWYA